jgi:hypothetical protein
LVMFHFKVFRNASTECERLIFKGASVEFKGE